MAASKEGIARARQFVKYGRSVSKNEFAEYRTKIIAEMKNFGATEQEIQLLQSECIINGLLNGRTPGDIAWAVMQ